MLPMLSTSSGVEPRGCRLALASNTKSFARGEYLTFTQQSAKAAMTRHLIIWLHSVLRQHGVSVGEHGGMRLALFDSWVQFESICERHGRFLPAADIVLLSTAVESALVCHNWLYSEALARSALQWQIVPKCHMATHLGFDFVRSRVNPRRVTNYGDEDMVGKMKRIMSSCHGGTAGRMAMYRYVILVGTRWWDRLARLRGLR